MSPPICCSQRFTGGGLFRRAAAGLIRHGARSVSVGELPGTPRHPSRAFDPRLSAEQPPRRCPRRGEPSPAAVPRLSSCPASRAAAPRSSTRTEEPRAARGWRPPGPAAVCPSASWAGLHRAAPGLNGDEKRSGPGRSSQTGWSVMPTSSRSWARANPPALPYTGTPGRQQLSWLPPRLVRFLEADWAMGTPSLHNFAPTRSIPLSGSCRPPSSSCRRAKASTGRALSSTTSSAS